VSVPARSDVAADVDVPTPPFWGTRVVKGVALADYTGLLDERALFLGQWGLRGARGGEGPSYEDLVESDGRPRLRYWLDRLSTDGVLAHAAVVYGYFPAVSEGDDVIVLTEPRPDAAERFRFTFPRQQRGRFLCIADFIRSRERATELGQVDVLPRCPASRSYSRLLYPSTALKCASGDRPRFVCRTTPVALMTCRYEGVVHRVSEAFTVFSIVCG
jgi:5-methyltetrahydrofolate--homocysteine methyltransferase